MNTQEIIKKNLSKLKDIKARCDAAGRRPNSREHRIASDLLDEIDALKWSENLPADPEFNGLAEIMPNNNQVHEGRSVGNLRSPEQSKEYRSLFPENRGTDWKDRDMSFFQAIFSGRAHPELNRRAMNEGTPADGGFLIPTEYSKKIHSVALENELVLPRCFVQPMQTNELKLPGLDIGDHSSNLYGGFTASWTAEAGTLTDANPKARMMTLSANKLTGFLRLSNELVADMPNGEKQLIDICGKGLAWYRDKAFLKGSGAGQPQGILNASCLIAVAKEAGQAANSIVYSNLTKMMSRMYAGSFQNSVWICHQSTIPQLLELSISVGTGGSFIPVLSESNGQFTILTRPVIFTEKTEVVGDQGDIILADLSQYIVGLRQDMRFDVSPHLYFATDEMAARIISRIDGQSLWDEALTLEDGSTTVSPFITLQERA